MRATPLFTIFEDADAGPTDLTSASTNTSPKPSIPIMQQEKKPRATPSGWAKMPQNVREMVYKLALPAYTELDPKQPSDEAIPAVLFKAYYEKYGALFQVDARTRREARDFVFSSNNLGVYYSPGAQDDLAAIQALSWDAFQTLHLDIHITSCSPIQAFFAVLSHTSRLKHLFIRAHTYSPHFPCLWESEDEVEDFMTARGDPLLANMVGIKTVNIDFVGCSRVGCFADPIGMFVQRAWMNRISALDSPFVVATKRALFLARPTITLSAIEDSKTFSNDAFV